MSTIGPLAATVPHAASNNAGGSGVAPTGTRDADLRRACVQLEAVFMQEMMKALRDTVPESGLTGGGAGEEIFSSLLDARLTEAMAERLERGIAAALYRQLRGPEGA